MCSTSRNQQPEGIRGTAQLNEQRVEGVQGRKPLIQCHRVRPPINIDDSEQSSGRWSGHEGFQSDWTSLRNRLVQVQNELSRAGGAGGRRGGRRGGGRGQGIFLSVPRPHTQDNACLLQSRFTIATLSRKLVSSFCVALAQSRGCH